MNTDPRHGDCSLWLVDGLPKGAKQISNKQCKCASFEVCAKHMALAHGEVSGHTHLLDTSIPLYEYEGDVYVHNNTNKPVSIAQTADRQMQVDVAHLEKCFALEGLHAPQKDVIAPGQVFKVVFPQEFNWLSGELERARD